MPELPEVETVVRTLAPRITGRSITSFDLRWHRTVANDIDTFVERVVGRTITGVRRRAKLIILQLDDQSAVTVHLRMTGELKLIDSATEPRDPEREPYLRALFGLSGGWDLAFYDVRKFGRIRWLDQSTLASLEHEYGVEPLEETFTSENLGQLLSARRRQIKPLLLDQRVIAGLGNIYVDEALYRAKVHPLQLSDALTPEQTASLHVAIVAVLSSAIEHHGTTLRDFRTGTGERGQNQSRLRIYGLKPGSPCPECGFPVERLIVGQRGSTFCPSCQPLPVRRRHDR